MQFLGFCFAYFLQFCIFSPVLNKAGIKNSLKPSESQKDLASIFIFDIFNTNSSSVFINACVFQNRLSAYAWTQIFVLVMYVLKKYQA